MNASADFGVKTELLGGASKSIKHSVHLKILNANSMHSPIIPEEYEPYSTGRWSINPHSSVKTTRGFMKIRDDIAKEYNMY